MQVPTLALVVSGDSFLLSTGAAFSATVALVVRGVRAVGTCDSLSGPLRGFPVRHTADWSALWCHQMWGSQTICKVGSSGLSNHVLLSGRCHHKVSGASQARFVSKENVHSELV